MKEQEGGVLLSLKTDRVEGPKPKPKPYTYLVGLLINSFFSSISISVFSIGWFFGYVTKLSGHLSIDVERRFIFVTFVLLEQ